LSVDESFNLLEYGLEAKILYLPGHSKGSIGILTAGGGLFCGDLFYNFFNRPGFICCINDLKDYQISIRKLKELTIKRVYPGHGPPFPGEKLTRLLR
jgi:hydroxyacylglutathione hydrolase